MVKDDLILPEEDGDSDTNSPNNKNTKNNKVNKTHCLNKCRRVGLIKNTVEIKLESSNSDYSDVEKASSKNKY